MSQDYTTTTIDLIRHGEPIGGQKFRGSQDDPLSARGWQQMRQAVAPGAPWQRVITSPLLRCCKLAAEVAERHDIPLVTEPRFAEIHFGDWEGLTSEQVMQKDAELLGNVWRYPVDYSAPGGETVPRFNQRVSQAWQAVLRDYPGEHLLVVSHGGTMRIILCHVFGSPLDNMWRFDVQFASMVRLRAYHHPDHAVHYSLLAYACPLDIMQSERGG